MKQVPPPLTHIGWLPVCTQQPPFWQVLPSQQAWFAPPQGTAHWPLFMQVPVLFWPHGEFTATQVLPLGLQQPALQVAPAQQALPGEPHTVQMPWRQTVPVPHMSLAQHAWPAAPHATHTLLLHEVLACVQLPRQQALPAVPQLSHEPLVHMPSIAPHDCPLPRHTPPTQQPPVHALLAQQGVPGAPHWAQAPFSQTVPAAVHVPPGQQALPRPPQLMQTPPRHSLPAVQVPPPQQPWPGPPQPAQVPFTQNVDAAVQVFPLQQPWPSPPQVPQLPFWQTPPPLQVAPAPVQVPFTQQPPPLQALF